VDDGFHENNEYMRLSRWEKALRAYPTLFHALVGQPPRKK